MRPIVIPRIMHVIIEPDRTVTDIYAEGRMFERGEGESEAALEARGNVALGWDDE